MPQKCRVCGEAKPLGSFRKKRKGGRFDICISCAKAMPHKHWRPRHEKLLKKVS